MSKEDFNKNIGMRAENYFAARLNGCGIPHKFVDDWYDFEVNGQKVEIKSCALSVRNGKDAYAAGRFDFTDEDNREKQFKNNVWVGFVLHHGSEFMFVGFVKAKYLKERRYVPLSSIKQYSLWTFEEFLRSINKKTMTEKEIKELEAQTI